MAWEAGLLGPYIIWCNTKTCQVSEGSFFVMPTLLVLASY